MSEWISVKDRLPDLGKPVLVWDRFGSTKTGGSIKQVTRNTNSAKQFWHRELGGGFVAEARYSHWMELPKPPE